jgi:hypothetical protein
MVPFPFLTRHAGISLAAHVPQNGGVGHAKKTPLCGLRLRYAHLDVGGIPRGLSARP